MFSAQIIRPYSRVYNDASVRAVVKMFTASVSRIGQMDNYNIRENINHRNVELKNRTIQRRQYIIVPSMGPGVRNQGSNPGSTTY